jgi:hypothetical protein
MRGSWPGLTSCGQAGRRGRCSYGSCCGALRPAKPSYPTSCGSPPVRPENGAESGPETAKWDHPRRDFPVEGGSKSYRVAQLPGVLLASLRPYPPSVFRRRLATLGVRFAHPGTWIGPFRRRGGPHGCQSREAVPALRGNEADRHLLTRSPSSRWLALVVLSVRGRSRSPLACPQPRGDQCCPPDRALSASDVRRPAVRSSRPFAEISVTAAAGVVNTGT